MRFHSEICHIEEKRAIVRVSAWDGKTPLGSALGEAQSCEIAEEKATKRLMQRLTFADNPTNEKHGTNSKGANTIPEQDYFTIKNANNNETGIKDQMSKQNQNDLKINTALTEPEDWSKELTQIDLHIKNLKWDRNQENEYLIKMYNLKNRSQLTDYSIVNSYIASLKTLITTRDNHENQAEEKKKNLMTESDKIIQNLNWKTSQARDFLKVKMNATSRKSLDIDQLNTFNKLLENELINQLNTEK